MEKKNKGKVYFTLNEEIITVLKNIKKGVYLSMNGITAELIEKNSEQEIKTFGVNWPRLKEIAQNYEPNAIVSQMLWENECREYKLIATLLMPPEELDDKLQTKWIESIDNYELSDAFAGLLNKKETHKAEIISLLDGDHMSRYIGIQLFCKKIDKLNTELLKEFTIKMIKSHKEPCHAAEQNAELNILLTIIDKHKELIPTIETEIERIITEKNSPITIYSIVGEEIEFQKSKDTNI